MPSLKDIPPYLQRPQHKLAFLHWLTSQPIDIYAARSLMRAWYAITDTPFTNAEHLFVERTLAQSDVW